MWVALERTSRNIKTPRGLLAALFLVVLPAASGCVTVRPEERAILADPKMRFQGDPKAAAAQAHAIENREGSFGGGSVEGGGCGCN